MADISAKQLGLRKSDLPHSIIEVISTLNKAGFEAYIVGGGVRDNLLGLHPKDFDAVTSAKPKEIKDIFGKRCRIIGRRFQLAHVYSGKDMIEVATFRAPPKGDSHTTEDGMIMRDNVWGNIEQDSERRDFSINAMYYQPLKGVVKDFCQANADIESKCLRLLGQAKTRIEEDPVRLLRALRFKAKLGFEFDQALAEQFNDSNWSLLEQVSPHRLYDETNKMFTGGYIVPLLPLLYEYGAMEHLFIYPNQQPSKLIRQVAYNTDKRIRSGKSINPAFFYAGLLWHNYLYQLEQYKKDDMPFQKAQEKACAKVIDKQRQHTAIPKFGEQFIRDIWLLQPKLSNPRAKNIAQLAEHAKFRAGFDFLLLREQCGEADTPLAESTNGMGEWWQHFQTLNEKEQQRAIKQFAGDVRRGGGSRKRRKDRGVEEQLLTAKVPKTAQEIETQTKQDSAEKAQLQLLSLAMQEVNNSQPKKQGKQQAPQASSEQPSPLFTVESSVAVKDSTIIEESTKVAESANSEVDVVSNNKGQTTKDNTHTNTKKNKNTDTEQSTNQQPLASESNPISADDHQQATIELVVEMTALQEKLLNTRSVPSERKRRH